jgi:hypothetical protein
MKLSIADLESKVGTLSKPSKMPCHGYSIPASRCKVGQKMRKVKGSICSVCYALKGRYVFNSVQNALEKRFQSLTRSDWVDTMVDLIGRKEKSGFFRWHDSGDLQSIEHLQNIVKVAKRLPDIKFWLPTREYNIVARYIRQNTSMGFNKRPFPENLTVRLSGLMLDGKAPNKTQNPFGLPTSGAVSENYNCLSDKQGNKCLDCRLCWDSSLHINYKKH